MSAADETMAADQARASQIALSVAVIREVLQLVTAVLDLSKITVTWPVLQRSLVRLIQGQRQTSADLAATAYLMMRAATGLPSGFEPARPREFDEYRVAGAMYSAGPVVLKKALGSGATPEQARDRMATTLSGTTSRLVLEAGRDVVEASVQDDAEALGWARIGDGDPCSWCAMLISRGAVYKSARTAGDSRFGGEKYHDHDGCQAVPIFDPESPILDRADELYAQWRDVTAGHGGKDAINVWRRWWENREEPAT